MPINFEFTYRQNNKHIFVPNEACLRRGNEIIDWCAQKVEFPRYFFHYASGGHVAALHQHLENRFFFRIDIQNFFYSIARNRVAAALHHVEFPDARDAAQWSCVKNPYNNPSYALPIGFIQSPILASLVLLRSPVAQAIEIAAETGLFISVYFDDLIGSANDLDALSAAYTAILRACEDGNFTPNQEKLRPPSDNLIAFNCELHHGFAEVTEARIERFFSEQQSAAATAGFEQYRMRVSNRNH